MISRIQNKPSNLSLTLTGLSHCTEDSPGGEHMMIRAVILCGGLTD